MTNPHSSTDLAPPDTIETLILDLLEWIGPEPRPYPNVIEAWRTSCPRLPIWEEANDRGYISRHHLPGHGTLLCRLVDGSAGEIPARWTDLPVRGELPRVVGGVGSPAAWRLLLARGERLAGRSGGVRR